MSSTGISTYLANSWLGAFGNSGFVVPTTYFQLHVGIPGPNGTANPSATTLRVSGAFGAAANGQIGFSGIPPIWMDMAAAETISYVSAWDASAAGNFLFSAPVLVPRLVAVGDKLALGAFSVQFPSSALAS